MATLGGLKDSTWSAQNSAEIDTLARFAVEEHNKKENALLELARVVKAQEQVVAGTLHHLTLEVIDAGEKKLYEAKIWVKPWLNFKELQEFKHAGDSPSITPSDLGAKKGGHLPGWQSVPVHDPVVQDAANHAIKTIQQRSNSLLPYELREIIHAKAESYCSSDYCSSRLFTEEEKKRKKICLAALVKKLKGEEDAVMLFCRYCVVLLLLCLSLGNKRKVIEESAKFDMLLKVKRGDREEKFKVEVHKNDEGDFHLNQMISDNA